MITMKANWKELLKDELQSPYFNQLENFLKKEYEEKKIYPPREEVFNLFKNIEFKDIKVVILGQDPYHGENQGNGIAFSVNEGIFLPPSLRNIFKELKLEYPTYEIPKSGNLMRWVKQGVFLLNTVLTVEEGKPNSHAKKGWENFTDEVIKKIGAKKEPVVFILWGNSAKTKKHLISNPNHLILESVHPSPLSASRGFFGCNHFEKTNRYLIEKKLTPIEW
ncbi:MAG: uracil-DNA glycosylase [Fusobacteriaceae bacterium]